MKNLARAVLTAALTFTPAIAAAGGPVFDPFVEKFAVGVWNDPAQLDLADGWPSELWAPATVDSAWFAAAQEALGQPADTRTAALLTALGDTSRTTAWRRVAATDLADPLVAGPVTGAVGPILACFGAYTAGDTTGAAALARRLAGHPDLSQAARVVWSLRAAALAPETPLVWPAADSLLAGCGPWDGANTWALAVVLRRSLGQAPIPAGADDEHGRLVGRLARTHLTADDLSNSPYGQDLRAALGAVSLKGTALSAHLAAHPQPPADFELQGWWVRGQRALARGDAAAYEALAGRDDLLPRWRLDLWRRASERRVLAGEWSGGRDDLREAYQVARRQGVTGSLRQRLDVWGEQALVGALAHGRLADARLLLDLVDAYAAADLQPRLAVWRARLAPAGANDEPPATDRVDVARDLYRRGAADESGLTAAATRDELRRQSTTPAWDLWRRWGQSLATQPRIPADRRAAAAAYARELEAADTGDACLAVALRRLARHAGLPEELCVAALAGDARRLTAWTSPPHPSPVPDLLARLRGSQADLHALLGASLWLGDMRGVMAVASSLAGTGLTRDQKRRFLYPLPPPGPVLDALLAAENDPALLLAIARNESAFEPAVRSRAGALGFMQVMPFHYPQRGARPGPDHWSQPGRAIARGDALVTESRIRYAGDPYRLLAAYNAGPEATARWDRQLGGGADRAEFAAWIGYSETRRYVEKVLIDRDVYAWILSGAGD